MTRLDFGTVDAARDPAPYVSYLETLGAWDALAAGKRRRTALLAADGRGALLDVGCGLGDDVRAMAAAAGPGGRAAGVDPSASLIAEARARTDATHGDVVFEVADGADMPFDDRSFDGARMERVLQHAADPDAVLAETRRVVRRGGLVVIAEPDWGAMAIDADPDAVRAAIRVFEEQIRNPWMGRELARRLTGAGLCDVTTHIEAVAATGEEAVYAGGDAAALALAELVGAERAATVRAAPFAYAPIVVATGVVPG